MLTVLDEYSRECLAIKVSRSLKATDVIEVLLDLFVLHGLPDYIRDLPLVIGPVSKLVYSNMPPW